MRHSASFAAFLSLTVLGCDRAPASPVEPDPVPPPPSTQVDCSQTSVGLTPLTDLGNGAYQGTMGGLYPGGSNFLPGGHQAAGLAIASTIGPLDRDGLADPQGRYAFISIGMSNTTQEFRMFMDLAASDGQRDPRLMIVDGAQGGQTAEDWTNPGCACWSTLDERIRRAGLTNRQVVAAWVKLANRQPSEGWPAHAQNLKNHTVIVLERLRARFPNLGLAYLSSRIYAGYATTTLNPEPYAYQSGFSVKWTIEDQLGGMLPFDDPGARAPWIAWGPYLWADGLNARSDGLTWSCSDLADDGTHPSTSGRQKVAQALLDFVRTDVTAREWYVRD